MLADALSRRDQDFPRSKDDERHDFQKRAFISPELIVAPAQFSTSTPFEDEGLQDLWQQAIDQDDLYRELFEAVQR